ncbi:MAG: hypothetical protein LBT10_04680 [Methanobrevibacter sp.]|jgi:hypothetical protein|nr:hypothetical protein [Methanobrevibacter sp.]
MKVKLRRYYCKECEKWYTVKMDKIIKAHEKIAFTVKDKIKEKSKTGRKSLRSASKDNNRWNTHIASVNT